MKSKRIGQALTVLLLIIIIMVYFLKPKSLEFDVKGRVAGFSDNPSTIIIEHEEIPGYMSAMTMSFNVKDTTIFTNSDVGDAIAFKYYVKLDDGYSYIDKVKFIADSLVKPLGKISKPMSIKVKKGKYVQLGDTLPSYRLYDQDGNSFDLTDYSGKKLLFTFIYTNCPVPDFCPLMSYNFNAIQNGLEDKQEDYMLVSVSFDPERDNPEVLKEYGQNYAKDFENWKFASGEKKVVEKICNDFGVLTQVDKTEQIIHNLRTVYIDKKGIVRKIWPDNKWTPDEVIEFLVNN